jgi:hypothetical protein
MAVAKKALPGSGKKGGAVFPRYALESSVGAAKRLVSKSHAGPVPKDIYFSGVLQATGPTAEIKASSLKQYGLVHGTAQTGLTATALAKTIASADDPERAEALKKAALSPKIFKGIFDAFHGDAVNRSRLRQRASELNVHPDMLDVCAKIYVESLSFAGLVTVNGDQIAHVAAATHPPALPEGSDDAGVDEQLAVEGETSPASPEDGVKVDEPAGAHRPARATINVTINLDSSLDTEKLAKQLALLKKFGAL